VIRLAYIVTAIIIGVAAYTALRSFLPVGLAIFGAAWITCTPVLVAIAWGDRREDRPLASPDAREDNVAAAG
jgi:multisubunit Na+/H+ antiporter MnhB subunit